MSVLRTEVHGIDCHGVVPVAAMGGGAATMGYYQKVMGYGPLVYFPQWEPAGAVSDEIVNGWDGAYTGVTLGQPGIGDGNTAPFFDGVNDYNNIWTAALAAAFNSGEGTAMLWCRVNALAVWTDGAARYAMHLRADANNLVNLRKPAVNNRFSLRYRAAGANADIDINNIHLIVADNWFVVALTWSVVANQVIGYLNGLQQGLPMAIPGVWVGNLAATRTNIGCDDSVGPANVWHGWLAHCIIFTRALAPAEIADLAVV